MFPDRAESSIACSRRGGIRRKVAEDPASRRPPGVLWPRRKITERLGRTGRAMNRSQHPTMKEPSFNVLGRPLETCSRDPLTGFFRNGCCDTGPSDLGQHTVCAVMTAEFLALSKYLGNDLSTPRPEFGFRGLKAGDQWCLCAGRFLQAHEEGAAPRVRLEATHRRTLEVVPLDVLKLYAVDPT